jgi:beta-glucosidase
MRRVGGLVVAVVLAVGAASAPASACGGHAWCNPKLAPSQRAGLVATAMTTAEKLTLVASGTSGDTRLGIPPLTALDGPNGVGEGSTHVTAFPDAETIAASWDRSIARAYGDALGAEAAGKGLDLLYAPTVNIVRTPLWGREAETLGEDPFLTGALVAPEILGIESHHVMAQVKHFAGNNQEIDRFGQPLGGTAVSDQVSERALQEIYFPAFRTAIRQGHVASVMCSYNRINTLYSCQNPKTLGQLKGFGLQGYVAPDAELAVRDDVTAVNAGVDNMLLGSISAALGESELTILRNAYDDGTLSAGRLDAAVRNVLTGLFAVGAFDHPPTGSKAAVVSTPAHRALATRVAEQATVLLKNQGGALPLSRDVGSIAVIGHDAGAGTQIEENGSPAVLHGPVVSPLAGIRHLVGSGSRVSYTPGTLGVVPLPDIPANVLTPTGAKGHGLRARFFSGQSATGKPLTARVVRTIDFAGEPRPLAPIPNAKGATAATWIGTLTPPSTGTYRFALKVSGVARLYIGGRLIVDANAEFSRGDLPGGVVSAPGGPIITFQGLTDLAKNHPVAVRITYATGSSIGGAALQVGWARPDPSLQAAAVNAARRARVAIVFANDVSSEGMDRPSLELPGDQSALITAVAEANRRTIVVLHTAGPVLMPWLSKVAGVIEAWYPGERSGAAIADTLFGRTDPAGRLPVTFPRSPSQGPATRRSEYPGIGNLVQYSEGIFVGYRYYDRFGQTPLFPFGFGLSYTTFQLTGLRLRAGAGGAENATVTVHNTGRRVGAEVVQAYLQFPSAAGEPPRQLKAFAKVVLRPRHAATVRLPLPSASFTYFSTVRNGWTTAHGRFRLYVGTSSDSLPLTAAMTR